MSFLFRKKKKFETLVFFDIGSGDVGGVLVRIYDDKTKLPLILKTARNSINYNSKKININSFTIATLKALKKTANVLYHSPVGAPDRIITVLAAPWYSSETKIVKIKKESNFIFNKKIADELIQKEISKTKKEHNKVHNTIYNEQEIIENHIMSIFLNGYKVTDPLGMKTKSVEMNTITTISTKFFLNKVNKTIKETFHEIPNKFSSFIVSFYFYIRDRYISPDSYLLLDIGGEVTEVGIVLKGILKSTLSFPFGKKTFLRYISTKLEVDLRDAKELFKLYISGDLSELKRKKLEPLFKSAEASWSESLRSSIENLPYILALPNIIFLTSDFDSIDYFTKILKEDDYIKSITIEHKYKVLPLKNHDFHEICKIDKNTKCDPFLMMEIISEMRNK